MEMNGPIRRQTIVGSDFPDKKTGKSGNRIAYRISCLLIGPFLSIHIEENKYTFGIRARVSEVELQDMYPSLQC
mgnify:CR=1 FL=1